MNYVLVGCRCLIGIVFLVSVAGKTRSRSAFEDFSDVTQTLLKAVAGRSVHRTTARWVAHGVMTAEIAVPILLIPARTAWLGFTLAAGVITAFAVAIAAALRSDVRSPCRCFGASQSPLSGRHLIRNGLLIVVALTGMLAGLGEHAGEVHPAGMVIAAGTASVLALFLIRFEDLADLFSPLAAPGSVRHDRREK